MGGATYRPVMTTKKHEKRGGVRRPAGRPASATSLHHYRTLKEKHLAELRGIEVQQKRGRLLPAADVAREWEGIVRDARAALLAVVSRVRARLPHLTAHDAAVL